MPVITSKEKLTNKFENIEEHKVVKENNIELK